MGIQRVKLVRVSVPTSTANVGTGFDVFSVALTSPRIDVEFKSAPARSREIIVEGAYAASIDSNPTVNPAGKALSALSAEVGVPEGYALRIRSNCPPSKGLGVSGAVAVGAVVCANQSFHLGLGNLALAKIAAQAEPSQHMDNVSASLFGGFNIVTSTPIDEYEAITVIAPPRDIGLAIVVPEIEKSSTEATRKLVPLQISTNEHIRCLGNAARVAAAFAKGDTKTIIEALPWDTFVESARANGGAYGHGVDSAFLYEEKKMLLKRFHVAETISGAGPSRALWYSLLEDRRQKRKGKVGRIQPAINLVKDRLEALGYRINKVFLTTPSSNGAVIT